MIRLHLSMLSSYLWEKGISVKERQERIVYALRLFSNTSGGLKDLASIKYKGNMIGPSTFKKPLGKNGKMLTPLRVEHLIATSFQDVTHFMHVLQGNLPMRMYQSGMVDNDLSLRLDKKYLKVLVEDGPNKFVKYQTSAIKTRFEDLVVMAEAEKLERFSIAEEVAVDTVRS